MRLPWHNKEPEPSLELDARAARRRREKKQKQLVAKAKRLQRRKPAQRALSQKQLERAFVQALAVRTERRSARQTRREKAGFYAGTMAVASLLGQRHGRFGRQKDDATGELGRMR